MFVSKLDVADLSSVWAERFGGSGTDAAYGISVGSVAPSSGLMVTGSSQTSMVWGSTQITGSTTAGSNFYGMLNADTGAASWITDAGDASFETGQQYFTGRTVAVDGDAGAVYAAKHFAHNVTLAGTTLYEDGGSVGMFVVKADR